MTEEECELTEQVTRLQGELTDAYKALIAYKKRIDAFPAGKTVKVKLKPEGRVTILGKERPDAPL